MQKVSYFAIVLDESSSMESFKKQALDATNSTIETIKKRSREEGIPAVISVIGFADQARVILRPTDCFDVLPIDSRDYRPNGMTALFDGVELAVKQFHRHANNPAIDASFVVMSQTDGEENRSRMSANELRQLIEQLEGTDRWTFAFQMPRGKASAFVRQFRISEYNVTEWETSARGMAQSAEVQNNAVSEFFTARKSGATRSGKFYAKVVTDLSNLSKSQVKRALDDVTDQYKLIPVQKTASIREFVEERTKKPYVKGSVFYELMKPEEIQPQKAVLLIDKKTGAIYGGNGARDMIGLPDGDYANVKPGQHGDYDIYVQSTSVNRKLIPGTKILLRY